MFQGSLLIEFWDMGCLTHVPWKMCKYNISSMGHISQGTCSIMCMWEGHPMGANDMMSYATPSCVPYKGGNCYWLHSSHTNCEDHHITIFVATKGSF